MVVSPSGRLISVRAAQPWKAPAYEFELLIVFSVEGSVTFSSAGALAKNAGASAVTPSGTLISLRLEQPWKTPEDVEAAVKAIG